MDRLLTTFINDRFQGSLYFGIGLLAAFSISRHLRKVNLGFSYFWLYMVARCLYVLFFPSLPYGNLNHVFEAASGQALALLFLIPFLGATFPARRWMFLALAVVEITGLAFFRHGLLVQPSLDDALLAVLLPMVDTLFWVFMLTPILAFHGATAIAVVGAQAAVLVWSRGWVTKRPYLFATGLLGAVALVYFKWTDLGLGANSRIMAYSRYMGAWAGNPKAMVIGYGPGSFPWCSMLIDKMKGEVWLYMHSDWLQLLFEYGVVGLLLAGWAVVLAYRNCWGSTSRMCALTGMLVFCLTYHPTHMPVSMLVLFLMFRWVTEPAKDLREQRVLRSVREMLYSEGA